MHLILGVKKNVFVAEEHIQHFSCSVVFSVLASWSLHMSLRQVKFLKLVVFKSSEELLPDACSHSSCNLPTYESLLCSLSTLLLVTFLNPKFQQGNHGRIWSLSGGAHTVVHAGLLGNAAGGCLFNELGLQRQGEKFPEPLADFRNIPCLAASGSRFCSVILFFLGPVLAEGLVWCRQLMQL